MGNKLGRPFKFPKEEIVSLYEEHHSSVKVAELLGCSQPYVFKVLKEAGIKMNGRQRSKGKRRPRVPIEVILETLEKFGDVKTTASELGYTQVSVYRILRLHGFDIKAHSRKRALKNRL